MMPETSVIIPTHNRRAMVREAIASVLVQRGASFELIVVDDGSTDGTWDDLQRLARDPVRVLRTGNSGPAVARNRGVALARGRYLAFLDSDDLWMPGKLASQVALMHTNPHLAISQSGEVWMRNGRRVNPARRHQKRSGDIFADSLRTCLISPSAVIMKRELLDEAGGFDETMAACEDYDLWLRILARHEAGLIDEPLVIRRAGHPGQLSATIPALDRFRILALAKLLGDRTLDAERRAATAEVIAEKCLIYAKGLARRSRSDKAAFFVDVARSALERWRHAPDAELDGVRARMRAMLEHGTMPAPRTENRAEE
jgi:glycosyltransferase involved in cell wall biosynthesis